jgi:hypothetical protein
MLNSNPRAGEIKLEEIIDRSIVRKLDDSGFIDRLFSILSRKVIVSRGTPRAKSYQQTRLRTRSSTARRRRAIAASCFSRKSDSSKAESLIVED